MVVRLASASGCQRESSCLFVIGRGRPATLDFSARWDGNPGGNIGWFPAERLTVDIYETSKLPMSSAIADFNVAAADGGTLLTLHYSYAPNFMGRIMKRSVDKQMRKGMGVLAKDLQKAAEGIEAAG